MLRVRARRDAEVTRTLNELFADERLAHEQQQAAAKFDEIGADWEDERW